MWPIPTELRAGSPSQSIIRPATTHGEESSSWTTTWCSSGSQPSPQPTWPTLAYAPRSQVRCASALLRAVAPGSRLAGRGCPARHVGSVDAFLEAFETAAPGDVLVVDNGGILDEACVGDLVALEAYEAGMEGMAIWGLHRDTADIRVIGLPVFSLGAIPTGHSGSTPARCAGALRFLNVNSG